MSLPLRSATSAAWLPLALAHFDDVLVDHAHCEKKAAAQAMALVNDYSEHEDLVQRCSKLAQEELRHFQAVHRIILQRGLVLGRDHGDPYAKELMRHIRHGKQERLVDRLLVCSIIEARSCERLGLLARGLEAEPELMRFYQRLAGAEAGHHQLFVDLATTKGDPPTVRARLGDLLDAEAAIVAALPLAPRIH